MAEKSPFKEFITRKISIIDNIAGGYQGELVSSYINHLIDNTQSEKVDWSEREKLKALV